MDNKFVESESQFTSLNAALDPLFWKQQDEFLNVSKLGVINNLKDFQLQLQFILLLGLLSKSLREILPDDDLPETVIDRITSRIKKSKQGLSDISSDAFFNTIQLSFSIPFTEIPLRIVGLPKGTCYERLYVTFLEWRLSSGL